MSTITADSPDPQPYRDQPEERDRGGFGWGWILILTLFNTTAWAAVWYYLLRPMQQRLDRQREGLLRQEEKSSELTRQLTHVRSEVNRMPALAQKIVELESRINRPTSEIGPHNDPAGQTPAFQPLPVGPLAAVGLLPSAPAHRMALTPESIVPPSREELGALFVREIKNSGGLEATTIWERYFAQLQPRFHEVRCRPLHWDRSASILRFHERPSDGFTDTGQCWLVQADLQSLLFFPVLASPAARKKDLPGCQITSSDDALLNLSQLAEFTPPIVAQSADGWTVRTEGTVEYH